MQVEVQRPAVCLNSGLDSANFRDHLRVGECQKPFEELAAILWIHKRSAGSFRKFQKQLILARRSQVILSIFVVFIAMI